LYFIPRIALSVKTRRRPAVRAAGPRDRLRRRGLHRRRETAQHELLKLDALARLVDVDADELAGRVVVEDDPFRDLPALDTRLL